MSYFPKYKCVCVCVCVCVFVGGRGAESSIYWNIKQKFKENIKKF